VPIFFYAFPMSTANLHSSRSTEVLDRARVPGGVYRDTGFMCRPTHCLVNMAQLQPGVRATES